MKIAIVTSTFPPYLGGIGNVAAANARELAKLGHQVRVFTPKYDKGDGKGKIEIANVSIKRMPIFLAYGNAAWCPALSWMLRGFDIIHLHYPYFGGAETIWFHQRKYKKRGAKIIIHYHMDVVGRGIFRTIFALHRKVMLPKIIKMADKVIVTSQDYANDSYLKSYIKKDPAKFIEVPNGVDSNFFITQVKDQTLLAKYNIASTDKIVLFVGGLDKAHYFKGVEYLIEAMSRLRRTNHQRDYKWKLVIVGKGDLKGKYQSLAKQFKIHLQTVFTDFVSDKDLPKYYNLADVVVLPSIDKSEAFGLALVEAMSCSKPVIASNLSGVRSVIDDKVNGLLSKSKNSDDLATKINYILSNDQIAQTFGQAGRKKVEQKYDWEIIGQKLEEVYHEKIS